jgi:hypothetical protein
MSDQDPVESERPKPIQRRVVTQHSVVRFTVLRAAPRCPVFHPGDLFFVRQHVLDTETSISKNFCYHTIFDLYEVYGRVRQGPVGGKEVFKCRDKEMVTFEVERMPDEEASIGRAEVKVTGCDRVKKPSEPPGAE